MSEIDTGKMTNEKKPGKFAEMLGFITGLVFAYAWIFLIQALMYKFFSTTQYVDNVAIVGYSTGPVYTWLMIGGVPFFLLLGHMIMYGYRMGGDVKDNDLTIFKGLGVGFVIWMLAAIYIQVTNVSLFDQFSGLFLGAGYLTMVAAYTLLKVNWKNPSTAVMTAVLLVLAILGILSYFHITS